MTTHGSDGGGNDIAFMPPTDKLPQGTRPIDVAHTILVNASAAARATVATEPNQSGRPVVGIVFEKDGSVALGEDGLPMVITLPVRAVSGETGAVEVAMADAPDRLVSPKEAASELGISISTLKRARYAGSVSEPHEISSRRTGWLQSELMPIVKAGGLRAYIKNKAGAKSRNR